MRAEDLPRRFHKGLLVLWLCEFGRGQAMHGERGHDGAHDQNELELLVLAHDWSYTQSPTQQVCGSFPQRRGLGWMACAGEGSGAERMFAPMLLTAARVRGLSLTMMGEGWSPRTGVKWRVFDLGFLEPDL